MHQKFYPLVIIVLCMVLFQGCGSYFNQPVAIQGARIGEDTPISKTLRGIPPPIEKVVVGVYKFRDQTGQYKPTETGSTFSTAITQGATTMLIKALEDSKWFIPIERENLSNLLNERNIIRSTRKEYLKNSNTNEPALPPLLYAGILLEGGVVSYDTNIITGGLGLRYFGTGGSTQYRQDRITVYLRAVSTSNGKILKTVYVSKTLLSQALDANFFRFVSFNRLLEAETGFTKNEPTQLAVSEAIEKAVETLIIEGIEDTLWKAKADTKTIDSLVSSHNLEKNIAQNTDLYQRYRKERRGKNSVFINGGLALIQGDYTNARPSYHVSIGSKWYLNPYININGSLDKFELRNENAFAQGFNATNINTELLLLPFERLSPFVFGGIGTVNTDNFDRTFFKFQYGAGLEYLATNTIGISFNATHNLVWGDQLDGIQQGIRDDQFLNFSLGLHWYFKTPYKLHKEQRKQKRAEKKELNKLKKRNLKVREDVENTKG